MPPLYEGLPAEIPPLLDAFAAGVRGALGARLVGLYIFGSALTDDFAPATSDLDFLGVTAERPKPGEIAALADLHRRLAAESAWAARLEGGYAARADLRPWGIEGRIAVFWPPDGFLPDVASDYSADNMLALREASVALIGPPAVGIVPEVDRVAFEAGLREYLAELVSRPVLSASDEELASRALKVARCLYGIETGRISTKREAAAWLAERAPAARGLLEAALAFRAGDLSPEAIWRLRSGWRKLAEVAASAVSE